MSIKSSLLRGMYGPKTTKSKYAFYRERELERGEIHRRSTKRFDAYLAKREARKGQQ